MTNRAVLFDLDGTLADTLPDILVSINAMLRHYSFREITLEMLYGYINRGARRLVFDALPPGTAETADDPFVTEALAWYSDYYAAHPVVKTKPFPGIPETLSRMKEEGWKLGVLSNKQEAVVRLIVDRLFPDLFDGISGTGRFPPKPSPLPVKALLEELGASPDSALLVGDSDIDMMTAAGSGLPAVGVLWGYRDRSVLSAAGGKTFAARPEELISICQIIFLNKGDLSHENPV